MNRLNPFDAVSPAFTRTHLLLFKPFRLGRSWKLAATSYLAFAGSFFFPFPLVYAAFALFLPGVPRAAHALLFAASAAATLIYCVVFYCMVRLELVEFEMVVTAHKMIAPMWRKYSAKVWPWIAAKVFVGLISLAFLAPIVVVGSRQIFASFVALATAGQHPDPAAIAQMMSAMVGFYALMFLLFLIPKTLATLCDDFVLPFFLLEDLPLLAAVRRGIDLLRADPLQSALYLGLKFLLAIAGYIMQSIALQICMIPVVLLAVFIVFIGSLLLRGSGPAGHLLLAAAAVVLGLAFAAVIMYVSLLALGYLLILLDSYAVYFLAGRYPLLGNLLDPGPGGPFTPPPVFPSPEEQDDSDGGPPMRMNPAVA